MNLSGIQVAVLSGLPEDTLYEAVMAPGLSDTELSGTSAQELDAIYRHLVATRDAVRQNPAVAGRNEDPQALLKMLDYAITYFKTDKRDEALSVLVRNEERINSLRGVSFEYDDFDGYDELGAVQPKKFFASVKSAVSNAGKAVAKAATTAAKAVVKYNPVSIVARNGYLLALKLNVSGMASKLKWGYATQAQAAAKGVSASDWQRSKSALVKVEKLFADKLQGSKTALQNAILKGKAGGLSGGYSAGLGEPITASAIAAAAPLIIATINILKEAGLIGNNVKVDANTIALEVASDPNAAAVMSQLEPGESSSSLPVQPEITENEAAVQRDSNTLYTENPTKPMENTNKPGLLSWVQANPIPSLAVAGIVSLIAYNLTSKESKSSSKGLSGYRSGKSGKSRKSGKASKSSKSGRKKKRRIETVLLR
jgi:hypothetical protein